MAKVKKSRSISNRFLLMAGGVVFFAGGMYFLVNAILMISSTLEAREWDKTPCKVENISYEKVVTSRGSGKHRSRSTSYQIKISFSYEYNGKQYTSNRFRIMGDSYSSVENAQSVVSRYRAAPLQECVVNPANPSDALFDTEFPLSDLSANIILPAVFMCLGILLFVLGFYERRKARLRLQEMMK